MRLRRGFTLIEVIVCIAIGTSLATLATTTFLRMRATMRRVNVRLEMHNTARFVFQRLRADLMAMQQDAALWLESDAGSGADDATVRLVFLRGKTDTTDFTHDLEYGVYTTLNTDLVWAQWRWDQDTRRLCAGSSSTVREWTMSADWTSPDGHNFRNRRFRNLPQPRRVAGVECRTTLDDNRFGSPDPRDIGDFTDLDANTLPTTRGVTAMTFELVLADGSTVSVDGGADRTVALDGAFIDGRVPAAAPPHRRRPRLVRVRMTMHDAATALTQDFAFSFATPDPLPGTP